VKNGALVFSVAVPTAAGVCGSMVVACGAAAMEIWC
jgi:hypothetical protein